MRPPRAHRLSLVAAAVAACAIAAPASAAPVLDPVSPAEAVPAVKVPKRTKVASAASSCPKADELPGRMSIAEVKVATLCLINAERRQRGLAPLKQNSRLARAGRGHAGDMVRARYFAHDSRSGAEFDERILRTGYARGARALLGENLAWGSGAYATPRRIVDGWMKSPGHRANILRRDFREIGLAVVRGTPSGRDGATYATEFGRRF